MKRRPSGARRSNAHAAGYAIAVLLAAYPVLRMLGIVLDAAPLQHADYWQLFDRFVTSGGGLDVGGLFHFNNEHPLVVPQLLLWANVELFHGSNVALGLIDVLVGVGQLATLGLVIARSDVSHRQRMALFVLSSVLVFSLLGTWNYAKAMSGVAWLTANLFALGAVYLRSRDRRLPAIVSGAVATASYGTGIAVWPALVLTGIGVRRGERWWREWPYALAFVLSAGWYRFANTAGPGDSSEPVAVVRAMAGLFGFMVGLDGSAGEVVGGAVVIAVPVSCLVALLGRRSQSAPWVGIAAFGWLATLLISLGRNETLLYFGSNRYASLPALTWLGLVGLLVSLGAGTATGARGTDDPSPVPARWLQALSLLVIGALAVRGGSVGQSHVDELLALNGEQERREIVLRLGLGEGNSFVGGFGIDLPPIGALLDAVDHHPFRSWGLDCGLLGHGTIAVSATESEPSSGRITAAGRLGEVPGAVAIDGTVDRDLAVRCLVLVDETARVVGAATLAEAPGTFRGIARAGAEVYRAVVFLEDDPNPHVLGGEHRPGPDGS